MKTRIAAALVTLLLATAPALAKDGAPSRLFPYYEEDRGVLILGQAMVLGLRQDLVVGARTHYDFLLRSGIPDADINDGSVVIVMLYCCGGKISETHSIWAYAPPGMNVGMEDFVEVRMGRVPGKEDPGIVNTITAVRQRKADGGDTCRWLPDESYLWMRVVECGDMAADGWLQRGKMRKLWYKTAAAMEPAKDAAVPVAPTLDEPAPPAAPPAEPSN